MHKNPVGPDDLAPVPPLDVGLEELLVDPQRVQLVPDGLLLLGDPVGGGVGGREGVADPGGHGAVGVVRLAPLAVVQPTRVSDLK